MSAHLKFVLPVVAGVLLLASAGAASACDKGCPPKPQPPAPKPSVFNNHNKNINNNINKNVNNNNNYNKNINNNNVNVNVNVHSTNIAVATANATATAQGGGDNEGDTFLFSGGGAQVIATPGFPVLQPLGVLHSEMAKKAFTEKRKVFKQVIVRAVCIDDRGAPHPASQIFPERDVEESYRGEVFRCIAGTKLEATIAEFVGKVSFDGGETLACAKGEALAYDGDKLVCRPAKPQRNCYERSLLRRFGVGEKVFKMSRMEEFTSYKEEVIESAQIGAVALDGGVGGFVH
jgi:hypothetical protein